MSNQKHTLPPMGHKISNKKRKKANYILPIFIVIGITFALMVLMNKFKANEEKKHEGKIIPAVEVVSINPIDFVIPITSEGMVMPKTSISFSAEISGKIISVADNFSNGGQFIKGDVLVKIDSRDYELAIIRAQANVASAKAKLDLEQAKSDLARNDWKKYGKKGKPTALNLNLPQVDSAKAALDGAKADLNLAKRNLDKTKVVAPFDGVIFSKTADVGQFVSTGMSLATIASTEVAEIRVALTDVQLNQSGLNQSIENVWVDISSEETNEVIWQGKVKQIEAQRDARTLMNYMVIEVIHPFTQQATALRFNTFVSVEFAGNTLLGVYPINRQYMLLNNKVKILDSQLKLMIKPVEVIYSDDQMFYISNGLEMDDRIITTQLPNVKTGSQLKLDRMMQNPSDIKDSNKG